MARPKQRERKMNKIQVTKPWKGQGTFIILNLSHRLGILKPEKKYQCCCAKMGNRSNGNTAGPQKIRTSAETRLRDSKVWCGWTQNSSGTPEKAAATADRTHAIAACKLPSRVLDK